MYFCISGFWETYVLQLCQIYTISNFGLSGQLRKFTNWSYRLRCNLDPLSKTFSPVIIFNRMSNK